MEDKNKEMRIVLYHSANDDVSVNAVIKDETLWITQKAMSELFNTDRSVITKHLLNIYGEGELSKEATCAKIAQVQQEGSRQVTRYVDFYNLDAIISVGYRVNSKRATAFRIWATNILKEYMIKGFVLDDERMKQGTDAFGKDYFQELLERVRSIRASERRIWQKITDIFAECSIDYEKNSDITSEFYATVQNKFHYAITGKTAAEIVYDGADHEKENMGLNTWKNAPDGRILKSDSFVAKNYLTEPQIRQLERSVSSYFDYIEGLIERQNTFTMQEFAESVNAFLSFNRYDILRDKGKISQKDAKTKAGHEYDIFNKKQKIESDFDKSVKTLTQKMKKE